MKRSRCFLTGRCNKSASKQSCILQIGIGADSSKWRHIVWGIAVIVDLSPGGAGGVFMAERRSLSNQLRRRMALIPVPWRDAVGSGQKRSPNLGFHYFIRHDAVSVGCVIAVL